MENKYTLDYIKSNGLILFECIGGSIAYGTNIESSDKDIRGVFIAELDDVLSNNHPKQINDEKNDIVFYELGRFIELLYTNNPNILELLSMPNDCVIQKNYLFNLLIDNSDIFITKKCKNSFGKYAESQIQKAKGLNKKQNIEQGSIARKDVLDFCYVVEGEKSVLWKKWNGEKGFDEKFCGVVNVPNAKDVYAVYFDTIANMCFSDSVPEHTREISIGLRNESGLPMGFGYKGLVKTGEGLNIAESNQLRLSSIPKGETPICNITYNKDAYTTHCKDYASYIEWVENRNESRYVQTTKEGETIDCKNMMHCMRLIRMVKEIGRGEGINVRRVDREELLAIRRGYVDLKTLIDTAEAEIKEIDRIFEESDLPNGINPELINTLLVNIRREFYHL
jgi:predicted nucleotidyltransferase